MSSRDRNPEIYIRGYSKHVDAEQLKQMFKKYGKIRAVQYKGLYSFIEFQDYYDAENAAQKMNGKRIDGQRLIVQPAGKKRRRPRSRSDSRRRRSPSSRSSYSRSSSSSSDSQQRRRKRKARKQQRKQKKQREGKKRKRQSVSSKSQEREKQVEKEEPKPQVPDPKE